MSMQAPPVLQAFRSCITRMMRTSLNTTGRAGCSFRTREGMVIGLRVAHQPSAHDHAAHFEVTLDPRWSYNATADQTDFQDACDRYINCDALDQDSRVWMIDVSDFRARSWDFDEAMIQAHTRLLEMLRWKMCECRRNLIVDSGDVCFDCHMGLSAESLDKHTCMICLDKGFRAVTRTACCGKTLHSACLQRSITVTGGTCPHCRQIP